MNTKFPPPPSECKHCCYLLDTATGLLEIGDRLACHHCDALWVINWTREPTVSIDSSDGHAGVG